MQRMRRMPRTPSALGALALSFAALTVAPSVSAGEVPKYGALPAGHLTAIPTAKAPMFIAASEKVAGFFVAMPKFGPETPARARHVSIVGDQKQADSIRKGDGNGDDERELGTCFSESQMSMGGRDEEDPEAREWSSGQLREVNLWPKSKDNETAGIGAVHSERLVDVSGKLTLESVDAWVDPSTQGARLIARASLPLVQVGSAVGGVKVYAGRDERDGAARFVQFVVVRSSTPAATRGTMMAMRQDGDTAHGNGCGHLRMPLAVDAKSGDSAIVIASVELASLEASPAAKTNTAEAPKAEEPAPAAKKAKPRFRSKRRGPLPAPVPPNMVERETRTRDMQIHLSVSQATRDNEPLVAVSFGWASRESVQRTMEEAKAAPAPPAE